MSDWTEGQINSAAVMWRDGYSSSQIAAELGKGRSGVLGIMHRNRNLFPLRGKKAKTDVKKELKQRRKKKTMFSENYEQPLTETTFYDLNRYRLTDVEAIPFIDLNRDQCRFPYQTMKEIGAPNMPCCGAATLEGQSYCQTHRKIMKAKPHPKRKNHEIES